MKKQIKFFLLLSSLAFMAGCGGGGGGGGGPATQAVTTVVLFGQMSSVSNSKIDSVQASLTVPTGVFVNYTAAPNAPDGTYPMRNGFAVASGLVKASGISGTYNTATRLLTVSLQNSANPKVALQSYTSARGGAFKGAEVAKMTFKLTIPGSSPIFPVADLNAVVGQYRDLLGTDYLNGCTVKYVTAFQ